MHLQEPLRNAETEVRNPFNYPISVKLCTIAIPCVITYAKCGDNRFRGGGSGQILPFPIDFGHTIRYDIRSPVVDTENEIFCKL